jgi:4-hydroxythreonine-4-phosphate dehydrogenase
VRTSPDHGTAFDIAGKNKANISSFKEAVFSAINIVRSRNLHQKLTAAPLEISIKKSPHKKKHY